MTTNVEQSVSTHGDAQTRIEEIHAQIARDAHLFFQELNPRTLMQTRGDSRLKQLLCDRLVDKISRNDGLEIDEAGLKLRVVLQNGDVASGFQAMQRALTNLTPYFVQEAAIAPYSASPTEDAQRKIVVGNVYYEYARFVESMGDTTGYKLMDYTATLLQYHRENSSETEIQIATKRGVNFAMSVFENTLLYYTLPHADKLWELTNKKAGFRLIAGAI